MACHFRERSGVLIKYLNAMLITTQCLQKAAISFSCIMKPSKAIIINLGRTK